MPKRARVFSRSERMSSGCPVRITYSVKRIFQFSRALGQNAIVFDFQLEADLVAFLKRDVEIAGVENLSQLSRGWCATFRPDRGAN